MDAEELIIIKEGTAKATVEDSTKTLGPGGLILLLNSWLKLTEIKK